MRTSSNRWRSSAAAASGPSGMGSPPSPRSPLSAPSRPASRHGMAQPASILATVSGPGPRPTTTAGTSINTTSRESEDGDRVHGTAGDSLEADRREGELELPPSETGARVGQILELAVVDEPQTHGHDADHV